jgi:hypothetical protein
VSPVRPEYEALAREFGTFAEPFGVPVDAALRRDLVLVAAAFEVVDRHVDAIADAGERTALCAATLDALRAGGRRASAARPDVPWEIGRAIAALCGRLACVEPFASELARFFARTEDLRCTESLAEYVRCVADEARCAAEMTLLVVPVSGGSRFARFFRVLAEIANLVDKLHDVRGDWSRGEVRVRPSWRLYARLAVALAARVPALLLLSPQPLRLAAWGARYVLVGPGRATGTRARV